MKNWKGVLTILLMSVLSLGFSLSAFAAETDALQLKSAVLMDAGTGTVLYEKNSHEAMPPASVTKVMTLLLIYEAEAAGQFEWEEAVQVSEHAASMGGSQVFLEPGETQTAAELTKCIAIASANDAAVAMAEFVAGSEEAFVERMNRKAEELGMQETHFVNACGLDVDGHETSAYDIALMSRELMTKFPEVQKYTTTWQDTIIHKTRKGESEFGLTNTNQLIKWYEGATGLKTGSTGKALYCLSGTAERNGLHLIGVVMAAPDFKTRFADAQTLLNYGYANCKLYEDKEHLPLPQMPVTGGVEDEVGLTYEGTFSYLSLKGEDLGAIEKKLVLLESIPAPVEPGQKAGVLEYSLGGKKLGEVNVLTNGSIREAGYMDYLKKLVGAWKLNRQ